MIKHPSSEKTIKMRFRFLHAAAYCFLVVFLGLAVFSSDLQKNPYQFYHEDCGNENLTLLRQRYDFDEFSLKGENEFEQMLLLKTWVYRKLKYSFTPPDTELRNALTILEKSDAGSTFLCSSYAAVYLQCALSMGWSARYIFLRRPTGDMHAAVDVWSNLHKKWIYIDPTWNIHLEKAGNPQSICEIRDEWIRDKGTELHFVFDSGPGRESYGYSALPLQREDTILWQKIPITTNWLSYTYQVAYVGRNNFFSHNDGSGRNIWSPMYVIKDSVNAGERQWPLSYGTAMSCTQLSHSINTCRAGISSIDHKSGMYTINLEHTGSDFHTPCFNYFQIDRNGSWKKTGEEIILPRTKLKSGITVRAVNTSMVGGPPCTIRLDEDENLSVDY